MLVLEASTYLQGQRPEDYAYAYDEELVYLPFQECDDASCGCMRGFAGMDSHRATTTAIVADRPEMTIESLCEQLAVSLFDGGWLGQPDPADALVVDLALEIVELASHYGQEGPGVVIERDGDDVCHRLPHHEGSAER